MGIILKCDVVLYSFHLLKNTFKVLRLEYTLTITVTPEIICILTFRLLARKKGHFKPVLAALISEVEGMLLS